MGPVKVTMGGVTGKLTVESKDLVEMLFEELGC
jgi:hypothetical protein